MGGKLFHSPRIPASDYLKIEQEICHYLKERWGAAYKIPRYYADKVDFGDLDVLVAPTLWHQDWETFRVQVQRDLGIERSELRGNVFSILYQNFQVDFFNIPPQHLESTYVYLSFNDLGNFIGKIYRSFHLKYAQEGLLYVFRRQDGHYKRELEVSKDFEKICQFIGLDYSQWQKGFDHLEEMFQWVISSPYFSSRAYEKPSPITRKRMRQRPTLQKFMAYLEKNQIHVPPPASKAREKCISAIDQFFPKAQLIKKIALEEENEAKAQARYDKFNGKLLKKIFPDLEGEALGRFIIAFKGQSPNFKKYIDARSQECIRAELIDFYQKFKP